MVVEKLPPKVTFPAMFLTIKGIIVVDGDCNEYYHKLCDLQEPVLRSQESWSRNIEGVLLEENVLTSMGTNNQPNLRDATVYKIWQPFNRDEEGKFLRWRKAETSANKRSVIVAAWDKKQYGYS
ncbi:MAG: hypothetical protein ACXACD_14505 [Candidatus Thorarchaeota archaeon]